MESQLAGDCASPAPCRDCKKDTIIDSSGSLCFEDFLKMNLNLNLRISSEVSHASCITQEKLNDVEEKLSFIRHESHVAMRKLFSDLKKIDSFALGKRRTKLEGKDERRGDAYVVSITCVHCKREVIIGFDGYVCFDCFPDGVASLNGIECIDSSVKPDEHIICYSCKRELHEMHTTSPFIAIKIVHDAFNTTELIKHEVHMPGEQCVIVDLTFTVRVDSQIYQDPRAPRDKVEDIDKKMDFIRRESHLAVQTFFEGLKNITIMVFD